MQFEDDRTEAQLETHRYLIGGTDRFLSGWGLAEGGASYAFWACRGEDAHRVEAWVKDRTDMMRVRWVIGAYRPNARHCAHAHVYVVDEGHPALA